MNKRYAYAVAAVFLLIVGMQAYKPVVNMLKAVFQGNDVQVAEDKQQFAIYLVKKESLDKALSLSKYNENSIDYLKEKVEALKSLELEKNPIVTEKDILKYHWNKHEIEFTKEFIKKHKVSIKNKKNFSARWKSSIYFSHGGCKLLNTKSNEAFVIVANGKRIYAGGFPLAKMDSSSSAGIEIYDASNNRIKIWNNNDACDAITVETIFEVFTNLKKIEKSPVIKLDKIMTCEEFLNQMDKKYGGKSFLNPFNLGNQDKVRVVFKVYPNGGYGYKGGFFPYIDGFEVYNISTGEFMPYGSSSGNKDNNKTTE